MKSLVFVNRNGVTFKIQRRWQLCAKREGRWAPSSTASQQERGMDNNIIKINILFISPLIFLPPYPLSLSLPSSLSPSLPSFLSHSVVQMSMIEFQLFLSPSIETKRKDAVVRTPSLSLMVSSADSFSPDTTTGQ